MSLLQRPSPRPTDITRPYWEAAAVHQLITQQCQSCGARQFYPRSFCIACSSDDIGWMPCSGKGRVYTYTVNHRASHESLKERLPYVVAMIDLDEGVRLMANIIGESAAQTKIGARVTVVFEGIGEGITLPQFVLDGG